MDHSAILILNVLAAKSTILISWTKQRTFTSCICVGHGHGWNLLWALAKHSLLNTLERRRVTCYRLVFIFAWC